MYTRTTTELVSFAQIITVPAQRNIEKQIQSLLEKIRTCRSLSKNEQQFIQQWENDHLSLFRVLQTEKEIEIATQAIFALLIDFIRPVFEDQDEVKLDAFVELETDLKSILKELLNKDLEWIETKLEEIELQRKEEIILKKAQLTHQITQPLFHFKNGSIQKQINRLIQDMIDSPLFLPEHYLSIQQWQLETQNYFEDGALQTRQGKETASQVLCFLLIDTIRPAYLSEKDSSKQLKLISFETRLKIVLEDLLDKDRGFVNRYIQSIQAFCNEQQLVENARLLIETQEQQLTQKIYQQATMVDGQLLAQLKNLKTRLQALIKQRQSDLQDLVQRLDVLMDKIETAMSHAQNQAPLIEKISERIIKDNQVFNQFCQHATEVLRQVN